jgi:raffinose/stachyose/melibiose transport system substrate-binding protein
MARGLAVLATLTAASITLAGCSVGSFGSSDNAKTTITFQNFNAADAVKASKQMIAAFEKENPDINVKLDTIPGGSDGDNLVKTQLSTGDMDNVFAYNSGSLFQALRPKQNLAPLTGEPWVKKVAKSYLPAVSDGTVVYGAPSGTSSPGGVLYNKTVYKRLGLSVPKTWDQFRANNEKVLADGKITPIEQTYGDSWTAQLFVLADFANVAAAEPDWAAKYTANKAHYADEPALQSFTNQQQAYDDGFFNKDFASATYDDGVRAVANGTAANYPILSGAISAVEQNYPDKLKDVGMFALPAPKAADTRLTVFLASAFYIPKTTTGKKLDAAKKFVAFTQSAKGCSIFLKGGVSGPFVNSTCSLPSTVPAAVRGLQQYVDNGKSGAALEYVSPLKGPSLPQLTVEVGSGIRSAASGAQLYDEDVKKQAQQLGLAGW